MQKTSRVEGTREEEEGQGGGKIVFLSKLQSEVIIEILMFAIHIFEDKTCSYQSKQSGSSRVNLLRVALLCRV